VSCWPVRVHDDEAVIEALTLCGHRRAWPGNDFLVAVCRKAAMSWPFWPRRRGPGTRWGAGRLPGPPARLAPIAASWNPEVLRAFKWR